MVIVFDLDDTLFPEVEFVRSAYRAIAKRYGLNLLPAMMSAATPAAAFDSTGLPIADLLGIYRTHKPDIRLPWQSLYVLDSLVRSGHHTIGLVTDGRSVTQRNKIEALGLKRFMREDLILISEEVGSDKIAGESFKLIMDRTGGLGPYIYIGDNPVKDFVASNRLGWTTVGFSRGGCGENIFKSDFKNVDFHYRPKIELDNLPELLKIVDDINFS